MSSQHDEAELRALFDYNPPAVKLVTHYELSFTYPNLFYNRHLDTQHSLKHVKLIPSLADEIAGVAHKELEVLRAKGQNLPSVRSTGIKEAYFVTKGAREAFAPETSIFDATYVARFYSRSSLTYCHPVSSTMVLHPKSSVWLSILSLDEGPEPELEEHPAMTDTFVLQVHNNYITHQLGISDFVWSCLDNRVRCNIREIYDSFQRLAVLQFHAPLAMVEETFRTMGTQTKGGKVVRLQCSTVGTEAYGDVQALPQRPDSERIIESLPSISASCAAATKTRRSARLRTSKIVFSPEHRTTTTKNLPGRGVTDKWPTITVKTRPAVKPDAGSFIQWAWMRAAKFDSSFIIFNCGKYERIGFRHRASQTLFLSDLIDVSQCSDPGYGQIQVGFYILLLRDLIDRLSQQRIPSKSQPKATKRKWFGHAEKASQIAKKPRTRAATAAAAQTPDTSSERMTVFHETSYRVLALLRMDYGPFNSPAPAALFRIGHEVSKDNSRSRGSKQKFTPRDYFHITLTSDLSQGSTGRVHDATIQVQLQDGGVYSCDAVAKVALYPREQRRLRHEYAVYEHMRIKNVKSIATIYGLFEDATHEALILVMSHAGKCIAEQTSYKETGEVTLTPEQRDLFKLAMTDIHHAGVRHYDIRPENLMLNDEEKATIIDFDQAKVGAGKRSREREFEHLLNLLDGRYILPNELESPPTSAGSPDDGDIIEGKGLI